MILKGVTKNEIIEALAREHLAENIVAYYCKGMGNRPELADLVSMSYLALLQMDEERIQRAYTEGWLPFLLRRIIINQTRTNHSPWRDLFRRYGLRNLELTDKHNNIAE